jgi:methyl-accepting chemotaxis protein
MREKEEEMRQNMEELQATQEESARRENEINSILTAINSTSLVVEYDMDGNIIHINERFLNILEMSRSDVINTHHSVFTSKNSAEGSYQTFWEKLRNGESITNVEVIKLLNGKKLWLNQTYSPILNLEDIPYKVINIAQDISERKLKEQEIEKHKQTLQFKNNELESINMAINESVIKCEISPDGKLLSANNNYAQVIGKPLSDVIGKNFLEMLQNEEKEFHDSIWPKLLMNQSYKGVVKRIRSNGEELWIMSTFTPVTDDKNEVYKIYFLGQNITEQKQKFQLLVDANKEIEKLHNLLKQNNIEIPGDD